MNQQLTEYNFQNFYDLYKTIEDPAIKKLLQSHMSKLCRVDPKTIRQWISLKSIPFYQSNRVTNAVELIAVHIGMNPNIITEKMLFPNYALQIEMHAEYEK
jgi:hypothetical protein